MAENTSLDARADALERKMSDELDVLLSKSALFNMADGQLGASGMGSDLTTKHGKYYLMDDDPMLPKMPAKPRLSRAWRFFRCRRSATPSGLSTTRRLLPASVRCHQPEPATFQTARRARTWRMFAGSSSRVGQLK